ncbi:MAG: hypothetical protein LBR08_04285 [Bacteroidales bacterium]|jgi:hypothetical protein|nr:hypothetical protein [Bacteroidales bacterium]
MKTKYLGLCAGCICLLLSAFGVSAQTGQDWKYKRWFVNAGGALAVFGADEMKTYGGLYFGLGFRITPRSYVLIDFSPTFRNPKELVGTFTYEKTVTSSTGASTTTHHTDGEITLGYTYGTNLVGWSYEFDFEKNGFLYLTPLVGSSMFSPNARFHPTVENEPDWDFDRLSMAAFGGSVMYRYKIIEAAYRFLLHTSGTMYGTEWNTPTSHQLRLGIRLAFGGKKNR